MFYFPFLVSSKVRVFSECVNWHFSSYLHLNNYLCSNLHPTSSSGHIFPLLKEWQYFNFSLWSALCFSILHSTYKILTNITFNWSYIVMCPQVMFQFSAVIKNCITLIAFVFSRMCFFMCSFNIYLLLNCSLQFWNLLLFISLPKWLGLFFTRNFNN